MAESVKPPTSTTTSPTRAVAGTLALTGFTLALLAGFSAGNSIEDILARAFVSLLGCLLVGSLVGRMCDCVVAGFLADYALKHPIPNSDVDPFELAHQIQTEHEQAANEQKKSAIDVKNTD